MLRYMFIGVGAGGANITYPGPAGGTDSVDSGTLIRVCPTDGSVFFIKEENGGDSTRNRGGSGGCDSGFGAGMLILLSALWLARRGRKTK